MTTATQTIIKNNKQVIIDSIKSAKYEGNDFVKLDTDSMISLYADKVSTAEYSKLDIELIENEIFEYAESIFNEIN
jgi:hypothetical protein